ncbi:putative ferric reductase transmembrane component [Candida viswanathii]|uniref:Putative ferric reductase transmembrane component n=1 Tax=Candida viswanathii TaxID=5486 RepID=A0A367YG77_9ASCO|nr:putative ferric reductase transmembrane component [Candida viswanathii]
MPKCFCTNQNVLATFAGCVSYNNRNSSSIVHTAVEACDEFSNVDLPEDWFESSYNYFLENAVELNEIPDFNVMVQVEVPIIFDGDQILLDADGYEQLVGNYVLSFYLGIGAVGYWFLVMILQGIANWSKVLFPGVVKKYFDCLIPTRYETVVILGFYAYIIVIHCIDFHYVEGVPLYDSKYQFLLRVSADRTGIIATIIMPLYYTEEAKETYFSWGIIATIASGLIMIQTMLFFRRNWYEMFVFIHVVMVAIFICGTWIHVEDLGYIWFVYPAAAVWYFDRLVRIVRLVWFGFPKARIALLTSDTIKVVIPKPHDKNIVWYCKVKGGMTHGFVEGPYGEATPAKYADTAVFIFSGSCLPGLYSEVKEMARRVPGGSKKVMTFIWVIKDHSSLVWFQEEPEVLRNTNIQTTIYVSKPPMILGSSDEKKAESKVSIYDDSESVRPRLEHIEFREGRPSIE